MSEQRLKVCHIITDLDTGGAEMMLYKLMMRTDRAAFDSAIVSLTDIGPVGEKILALGVPVHALGIRRSLPDPSRVLRLARWLRQLRPHIVQTWMYHADLVGGIAAKFAGKNIPIAWNIRHSHLDPESLKRSTIRIGKLCARLSRRIPTRIVCCSEAGRQIHAALGYPLEKIVVIPNGFDITEFQPDPVARDSVRCDLAIPREAPLIGLVGRYHPMKDHGNFVQAASRLSQLRPDVYYLLCGDGITWENQQLTQIIDRVGLRNRFRLLGRRTDVARLDAAMDIAALTSCYGEGFPNVVGEAMACGVPCVVTDVGDAARIVGDTGRVVPLKDATALAAAWTELICMEPEERARLGRRARQRIQDYYAVDAIVQRYEAFYEGLYEQQS